MRVPHVEQTVVQVFAVCFERRLAVDQPPCDGHDEVEQRNEEDRERNEERDEGGNELFGVNRPRVNLTRNRDGRTSHDESDDKCARIAHEHFRRVRVDG